MKILSLILALYTFSALALSTGEKAPEFTLEGTSKKISLSDFKGKVVVLEWTNHGCPFVRKHYDSGNMQSLQKKFTANNVIWLSIISSAPGKQGHVNKEESISDKKKYNSSATDILLDPSGKVGQLYGAKTTPHMYVINKDGTLVYQGAIDDKADADKDSIPGAKNYVAEAISAVMKNQPVQVATTKAYGCGVKY